MEQACPWMDNEIQIEEIMGQPAFLTIGFIIHLPESNMGSLGEGFRRKQYTSSPWLPVRKGETAKSNHRYPDGCLQESSLTCWVSNSFQQNKCRFINGFFLHVSSGWSFRLRLSKARAHTSNEDLRPWGTVKTSKVNYLTSLMRHLRLRPERILPEEHSKTGSIPDTCLHTVSSKPGHETQITSVIGLYIKYPLKWLICWVGSQ